MHQSTHEQLSPKDLNLCFNIKFRVCVFLIKNNITMARKIPFCIKLEKKIVSPQGHKDWVTDIAISGDKKKLVSSSKVSVNFYKKFGVSTYWKMLAANETFVGFFLLLRVLGGRVV